MNYLQIKIKSIFFTIVSLLLFCSWTPQDEVLTKMSEMATDHEKLDYLGSIITTKWYSNSKAIVRYAEVYDSIVQIKGNEEYKVKALNFKGMAHYVSEEYDSAIHYYLEAIRILETKEIGLKLSQVYNNLAGCYKIRNDFKNTEKYFLKALEIGLIVDEKSWIASVNNNLAVLYMENEFYVKADLMFDQAIKHYKQLNDSIMLGITYMNQGNSRIFSTDYTDAINNYYQAMELVDIKQIPLLHAVSQTGIGIALTKQENYSNALPYLNEGLKVSKDISHFEQLMESYKALSEYYAQTQDFQNAYDLSLESQKLKDSVLTKEQDQNMAEALTKYETEKKEREILEQKNTITKKNQQRDQILFGLIALGIISIITVLFFRNKLKFQKTIASQTASIQHQKITELHQKNKLTALNSMIEGQEAERLRIAKDLHDSLGGLLSTVKAHFSSIQKDCDAINEIPLTNKTQTLIDEACIEVRRISHNMMPHALSISGLEGAIEDLGEHLNEEGFQVTVEISNLPTNIDETKKIMIYRLVQEILSNTRKHAEANSILIQLLGYKNEVNLIIEDDGKGFNYDDAISEGGLGLKSINSRVEFLDGKINWDSPTGNGTTVTINIPVV